MKKQIVLLLIIVLISAFGATTYAAPNTYIFSGNVLDITVDDGSVDTGVTIGDAASYSLLIDFDILGTLSTWDGGQYVAEELDAITFGMDTFYAQYSDGYLIGDSLIATTATPDLFNYGYSFIGAMIFVGTQDHALVLNTMDGINWYASEQANDNNGDPELITISSGGTLTMVPEPSSVVLMFTGLIVIAGFMKRCRSQEA